MTARSRLHRFDPVIVQQQGSDQRATFLKTNSPSAETARRLKALAAEGRPIVTAMYSHAEHGIFEYETLPDGTRISTRNPDGYFRMMRDFIRTGRLQGRYGSSVISDPSRK